MVIVFRLFSQYICTNTRIMTTSKDHFMYFAYGSNLLKNRIHIGNPSAEFVGVGRLDNHILDFIKYTEHWGGPCATIVPKPDSYIWGAIWRVHNKDMPALDRYVLMLGYTLAGHTETTKRTIQEGVDTNWYFAKTVEIVTLEGETVKCRTYEQTINPPARGEGEGLPLDRRPSITYLDCIVRGAIECKLPQDYIDKLKTIPHNGQEASPKMIEKLKLMK